MFNERKLFFQTGNPEGVDGGGESPTEGSTEVLDATTQSELSSLALNVDILSDSHEEEQGDVDKLFEKINSLDENKKNAALKHALSKAEVTVGNSTIKISKLAYLFSKYVEQDGTSRKIKKKEGATLNEGDSALIDKFVNEKNSQLAYLLQKSANFVKIQAENGYGSETARNQLREIREDKVLGNQTRRALAGLKSWIEGGQDIKEDEIAKLDVDKVVKMRYVSKELRDKIVAAVPEDSPLKKIWENIGKEDSEYEYRVPYTNNFAIKRKDATDEDEDLTEYEKEDKIAEENHDVDGLTPEDEKIDDVDRKVYTITDLSKIPETGKWTDEKKVFKYTITSSVGGVEIPVGTTYKFLNNGTCYKIGDVSGVETQSEGPFDSVSILKKLKAPEYTSDNITTEEMKSYVNTIKEKCADALKISDNESLGVTYEGKKLKITLGTGGSHLQYMGTSTSGAVMTTTTEQILSESFDIKQCLKGGNVDDPEYGNIDTDYVENVLIKRAKEKLVNQKKAMKGRNALVNKYKNEENGFTLEDLFNGNPVLNNDRKKGRLITFFSKFDNKKLVLDKDTTYEGDTIKLEFDDSWGNESYNNWKTNPDLKIKAEKIIKDDYTVDEGKFKEELKERILNIIERDDFK